MAKDGKTQFSFNAKLMGSQDIGNHHFGLGFVFVLLVVYSFYELSRFSIFNDEFKFIETISVPGKDYLLRVYYIQSNASSQSYIQVRTTENDIEEVLESYERYNYFSRFEISDDKINLLVSDASQLNTANKEVSIILP